MKEKLERKSRSMKTKEEKFVNVIINCKKLIIMKKHHGA